MLAAAKLISESEDENAGEDDKLLFPSGKSSESNTIVNLLGSIGSYEKK